MQLCIVAVILVEIPVMQRIFNPTAPSILDLSISSVTPGPVMHFCYGQPTHFYSGVDTLAACSVVNQRRPTHAQVWKGGFWLDRSKNGCTQLGHRRFLNTVSRTNFIAKALS